MYELFNIGLTSTQTPQLKALMHFGGRKTSFQYSIRYSHLTVQVAFFCNGRGYNNHELKSVYNEVGVVIRHAARYHI